MLLLGGKTAQRLQDLRCTELPSTRQRLVQDQLRRDRACRDAGRAAERAKGGGRDPTVGELQVEADEVLGDWVVDRAEGVLHKKFAQLGQRLGEFGVVFFFFGMKTEVFQEEDVAVF